MFSRAQAQASGLQSTASTGEPGGRMDARPLASAPLPVPKSAHGPAHSSGRCCSACVCAAPCQPGPASCCAGHASRGRASRAKSISSSVSGRGVSTPGPTASVVSRQCATLHRYWSGVLQATACLTGAARQHLPARRALLRAHLPCNRRRQSSSRSWSCKRSDMLQPPARPTEQRFTSRHALQRCVPGPQQAPTASSSSQSSSFCSSRAHVSPLAPKARGCGTQRLRPRRGVPSPGAPSLWARRPLRAHPWFRATVLPPSRATAAAAPALPCTRPASRTAAC